MREHGKTWMRSLLTGFSAAPLLLVLQLPPQASCWSLQEGGVGEVSGRPVVPEGRMSGNCTTMVSPRYPPGTAAEGQKPATVILLVVIERSGSVIPMRRVSGPVELENEAMHAVRQWHYRPYVRLAQEGPVDVVTNVEVAFRPGQPGGFMTHPNH